MNSVNSDTMERLSFSLCDTAAIVAAVAERAPKQGYPMSLTGDTEIEAVISAVDQGIDSHLEACYIPDRDDSYLRGERAFTATEDAAHWRKGDRVVHTVTLECRVSAKSLPVLVRRLLEMDDGVEGGIGDAACHLASAIADSLEIECV